MGKKLKKVAKKIKKAAPAAAKKKKKKLPLWKKRYRDMIKSVTTVKRKTKPNKGPSKKKRAAASAFDKLRVAHAKLVKKLNKQVAKKAAKKSKGMKKKMKKSA